MTTAQVVETSVTVNNNSAIQDYVHLNDQTQPTFEIIRSVTHFLKSLNDYNPFSLETTLKQICKTFSEPVDRILEDREIPQLTNQSCVMAGCWVIVLH